MILRLGQVVKRYDDWAWLGGRGGYNNINSVPPNGLAGLGDCGGACQPGLGADPLDWLSQGGQALLKPAQEKLDRLDKAIKALLVMGAVSSLTGLYIALRR